jgi:hypothetical protein
MRVLGRFDGLGLQAKLQGIAVLGTPRVLWQRVRKALKRKEMSCRGRQKSEAEEHPSQQPLGAGKSEGKSGCRQGEAEGGESGDRPSNSR